MRQVLLALSLGLLACDATIGAPPADPFGPNPGGPTTPGPRPSTPAPSPTADGGVVVGTDGGQPPASNPDAGPPPLAPELPAPMPHVVRLTHEQWGAAVRDLLQLPEVPAEAAALRADPRVGGFLFENDGPSMDVDQALWDGYQRAAGAIAARVAADPTQLARVVAGATGNDEARATAIIDRLGRLAHRRPLTTAERDAYLTVYRDGVRHGTSATFQEGVRLLLEALIQAPAFVYRVEQGAMEVNGQVPLDGYELATRLALTIWGTIPDDALLTAAAQGELNDPARLRDRAAAMLADPRATETAARYHALLLDARKIRALAPLPDVFQPRASLAEAAAREQDLFIRWIFDQGGSYGTLLTSNVSFVNDDLARLYGLSGNFGATHTQATLDGTRKGLFTHIAFLAVNATTRDPDPIHRGVFLTERIACNPLGAPPGVIPPLPPAMGRTNRQTVEAHTEVPGSNCASCHTRLINPFGFPFEKFDVVGRLRSLDNGNPIDTRASPFLGDNNVPVADAAELAAAMAASEAVHRCYAKHWVEFSLGRKLQPDDQPLVEKLTRASTGGAPVKELFLSLVTSVSFRTRSTTEMP